jgi:uncharacterized protein
MELGFLEPESIVKIHIDKIGDDGLDINETLSVDWFTQTLGKDPIFHAENPGFFTAHLARADEVVHVQGESSVELDATCVRCLEPLTVSLKTPLDVTLFPRGKEPAAKSDGEVAEDDLGVSSYEHQEIDLESVVREAVFLDLPMNPVCQESCKGLCATCGINLNRATCDCAVQPGITPWEALKQLKI